MDVEKHLFVTKVGMAYRSRSTDFQININCNKNNFENLREISSPNANFVMIPFRWTVTMKSKTLFDSIVDAVVTRRIIVDYLFACKCVDFTI